MTEAEKTLEERVADLERMVPIQIRALSRLNDQETASIKADFATLRAQMLAGFASVESRLDAVEQDVAETNRRLGAIERDVAETKHRLGAIERELAGIKQALDTLPRVLAEEIAKSR
jgi:uncharacterized coiled-coil protein SlyX